MTEPASRRSTARIRPVALVLTIPAAALLTGTGVAGIALDALLGAAVLIACALAGGPPLRWLRLPEPEPVDRGVLAVALGAVGIGLLLFGIGAIGLLRSWTVLAAAGAAAGLGAWFAPPWKRIPPAWSGAATLFEGFAGGLLVVVLLLAVTVLLAVSAVPVWDWDSLVYHLTVPRLWLREGRIYLPLDNPHTAYAGLIHMLYLLPLALGRSGAVVVVSGLLALVLALALARVVALESDRATARLAIGGLTGTTMVTLVAVTPRIDITLLLYILLAHWAVLQVHRGRSGRWLLAAALLGGAGLATKLHAILYLVPLAVWVIWLLGRRRVTGRTFALALALMLAVTAPWLIKNALLVGDPLHPLLGGTFFPPWLMEEPGVAAAAERVDTTLESRGVAAVGLRDLLLAPHRLAPEYDAYFYVWSPLLVLGFIGVLLRPRTWRWAVPPAVYLALLFSWSLRLNPRYMLPALPGLSVASALALHTFRRWPRGRGWLVSIVFVLCLLPLMLPLGLAAGWVQNPGGHGSRYESIYAAAREVSDRVPADGLVLMLYDGRGWPFDRPVLQDNLYLTWPLLVESGHADTCLRELETPITHVLINTGVLNYFRRRGASVQHVSDGGLNRFVERCLAEEVVIGLHRLYRLAPPRPDGEGRSRSGTG